METLMIFRALVLRITLALTVLAGGLTYLISPHFGKGLILGGIAGALGFWVLARQTFQLADSEVENRPPTSVKSRFRKTRALSLLCYAAVLYKAYTLDPAHLRGLFGAALGLLIIRLAVTLVGVTGWDLKKSGWL